MNGKKVSSKVFKIKNWSRIALTSFFGFPNSSARIVRKVLTKFTVSLVGLIKQESNRDRKSVQFLYYFKLLLYELLKYI